MPGAVGSLFVPVRHRKTRATQARAEPRETGASVQCLDQIMPEN